MLQRTWRTTPTSAVTAANRMVGMSGGGGSDGEHKDWDAIDVGTSWHPLPPPPLPSPGPAEAGGEDHDEDRNLGQVDDRGHGTGRGRASASAAARAPVMPTGGPTRAWNLLAQMLWSGGVEMLWM